ncbi:hypothetical protein CONLIGDRAFT_684347 [Coniochaeta ligniaria NRRL 30616]|uniref:Phosphatidylglycerol/phosphatidylinositol transfer protein n=1 Tax=Coniochaeta ligniaria NRRL 30616 TaxID=1408157 RepID=A0A1J7IXL1_9PEZI|nr:hypothetical protein CONLIGDRAFT_684347 [Coniochaeta ligniaria NRRL 30616]
MHLPSVITDAVAALAAPLFPGAQQQPLSGSGSSSSSGDGSDGHPRSGIGAAIPGGSPFSLCAVSRPTDLLNITYMELFPQPVWLDDMFQVTTYGTVLESWEANGTTTLTLDCGSHCEEYGQPEEDWAGENFTVPGVCGWAIGDIQQPVGGPRKRNETCPPVAGPAVITSLGWVPWILIYAPAYYNFTIDAKTNDGRRIFCITTELCMRWEDPQKNEDQATGPWANCTWPR